MKHKIAKLLRTQELLPAERSEAMRAILSYPTGCYAILMRPGKAAPLSPQERASLVAGCCASDQVAIKVLTQPSDFKPNEKLLAVQALLTRHPHLSVRIQRWMRLANTTTITTEVFLANYANAKQ